MILESPSYEFSFSKKLCRIFVDRTWHCILESVIDFIMFASCSRNSLWFYADTILNNSYSAYFLIFHTFDTNRLAIGRGYDLA